MSANRLCPFCDYTTSNSTTLNSHVFKNHKAELNSTLAMRYYDVPNPIAPFTITVPKYDKDWIICLCCKDHWTSRASYDKHLVKQNGYCAPGNQLANLSLITGYKFSDKAKEQTAVVSLMKTHESELEKLQAKITKNQETIDSMLGKIKNLENRVFKIGCCKCAGNSTTPAQNATLTPSPKATPEPPPKPTVKPPLPNQIVSDDDEKESSSEEEAPKTKPEVRCVNAATCGDRYATRDCDLINCKGCKVLTCRNCVKKAGSNQLKPYCSLKCKGI